MTNIIRKVEIVINNYNPYDEIIKDERFVMDGKKQIGNKIIMEAHLIENKDIVCSECESKRLIKNGHTYRKIKDRLYPDFITIINLKLQKYKCNECGSVITDTSSIVEKNHSISTHLRMLVIEMLRNDVSLSQIAKTNYLSIQEVYNIFLINVNISRHKMPEVLCIDEFKNLKTEEGSYAVCLYDPVNHIIIDVLPNRQLAALEENFCHIDTKELDNVKYLVSDMFETFRTIKKRFFKNATHIIDGFHFSRYVSDAFDKTRIEIMKSYDENTPGYKVLKKYWKIFIKRLSELNTNRMIYNHFKGKSTILSEIITDALNNDAKLSDAYSIKETYFILEVKIKYETKEKELKELIQLFRNSNNDHYIKVANMFDNWFEEICNSFIRFGDRRLNNAYIEGMNNRIKEIKRVSYGCRNFYYFRNRLMFVINPNEPLTRVAYELIPKLEYKNNKK